MLFSVLKTKEALLPVVVGKKSKREEANILINLGAQIGLVRDDVARRLKVGSKDVTGRRMYYPVEMVRNRKVKAS